MKGSPARIAKRITLSAISRQWDAVAPARDHQLRSGADLSFSYVLVPSIERLARSADWSHVLDAGCGTGVLTERLARHADRIVGVDMSAASIRLARESPTKPANVRYVASTLQRFTHEHEPPRFSLIVANMLLQDAPNLASTLTALAQLLTTSGQLIATVTHPFFWPAYWDYDRQPWFNYERETAIEAPFRISLRQRSLGCTTHFHRPLSMYVTSLTQAELTLDSLVEPRPAPEVAKRYPSSWRYPRFMALRCVRLTMSLPSIPEPPRGASQQ
ncbi:MAG: class I SAM-dependent methyltransferase [Verrucomicrobia bacterium]|nr:class I SAM-dependent methyltransferase [Verrucomicrobiota bacterium]